ncbi:hypothetical protein [Paraburkholderia humisilvae]|uniref:Uncharacterized protein n=1 Tax=Paraburkholderia humisilvae TaxID=627669 RepID=A0A6J5ENB0_9BURK|nr:hypothetical protein [Paraburkholderia humisilvae]CAB3766706.1 hypothetical protein LMG29542_05431 [Paraburkholderia humisilvae]
MKELLCVLLIAYASLVDAGVYCDGQNVSCNLYIDSDGALRDRLRLNKVVASSVGREGVLANVSVIKYQDRYVIIRESFTNDQSTLAVPLEWNGNDWLYGAAYMFALSLIDSSREIGKRWFGEKIELPVARIDSGIWDHIYGEFSKNKSFSAHLYRWPDVSLKISKINGDRLPETCFLPLPGKEDRFPVESIACRPIGEIADGGSYELSGTIGKYAISSMRIERQGSKVSGCYRYTRRMDNCLKIHGKIYENESISLREFASQSGRISGLFQGRVSHGRLSGRWNSTDDSRILQFNLLLQGFPDG